MDSWLEILSLIGTLVLMLAVFVGAYYASRLIGRRYQPKIQGTKTVEILERTAIGKEQFLLVIKTGSRAFLLGVAPQHIETICELDPAALPESPPSQGPGREFRFLLKEARRQRDGRAKGGEEQ